MQDVLGSKIKKIVSAVTWVIFILLFFFTLTVAVAQRSLPGEPTYVVKIGLEKFLITFYQIFDKNSVVGIDFTQTRYDEFQQLLYSDKADTGINNLRAQIEATRLAILNTHDEKQKSESAKRYIAYLKELSLQLERDKAKLQYSQNYPPTPTPFYIKGTEPTQPAVKNYYVYTPQKTESPNQQTQVTQSKTTTVTSGITDTQTTIQNTIDTLNTIPPPNVPTSTPTPTTAPNQPTSTPVPPTPTSPPPPTPTPTVTTPRFLGPQSASAPPTDPTSTPTNTPTPTPD